MKFKLTGAIWYAVGSCRDDRSIEIDEKIIACDTDDAIKKAKKIVQDYHKKYSWHTDYGIKAELQATQIEKNKTIFETVWKTHFENDQRAQPAIPAQPAKPFMPKHFEEERMK